MREKNDTEAAKKELIDFMQALGFDWICDIAYVNGQEIVASQRADGSLWWRNLEVEGSGFTHLFKGSIRHIFKRSTHG